MHSPSDRVVRVARPVAVVSATAAWVVSAVVNGLSGWGLAGSLVGGGVLRRSPSGCR